MSLPPDLAQLLTPPQDFDARPAVEWLIRQAARAGASDLHLRPNQGKVEVLTRVDGVLAEQLELPGEIYERLLVGLKNMARVQSFRKSTPQDGRLSVDGCEVRLATGPSHFGEKVIMRLVRSGQQLPDLEQLGLEESQLHRWQSILRQPQGLLLATGPAGSGKTTTLYASLRWLWKGQARWLGPRRGARLNVVTLEDPIEVVLPEFTQTPLQPAAGMTFASGLRSLLRQDPDVILVGEIRDPETAAAAVQSSLTGHLVLSTVHARDSVGVAPRLLELGVEPYLLSAALGGVIYQRLLRRLCAHCKSEEGEPIGCDHCDSSGYRGRVAVAEVMTVSEELRQGILDRLPLARLRRLAEESGMLPLLEGARLLLKTNCTSQDEVQRCVGACG
ncbi:MAG: type II/IV secretion system protein [Candidatus Eremiobacteraeota bacterium]|nr:type II/IV secretion system protein [Candidatus Eremiobacteraeota bacterium]